MRARLVVVLLTVGLAGACATAGTPREFRIASNREPADAFVCAVGRLEAEGFTLVESDPTNGTVAALRPSQAMDPGVTDWWRIDVRVTRDPEGRTLIETVAGSSANRDGPYGAPHAGMQSVVGRLSASCTW